MGQTLLMGRAARALRTWSPQKMTTTTLMTMTRPMSLRRPLASASWQVRLHYTGQADVLGACFGALGASVL